MNYQAIDIDYRGHQPVNACRAVEVLAGRWGMFADVGLADDDGRWRIIVVVEDMEDERLAAFVGAAREVVMEESEVWVM